MSSASIKAWISAFRLRTLPLSFSLIIMGSAIAWSNNLFDISIFALAILTTLFLQILSNVSNDYGDAHSGVDFAGRVGPQRAVQSGSISMSSMRRAIFIFAALALASGVSLLCMAYNRLQMSGLIIMLTIGLLSIVAAICYTVGAKPYGYRGLGDVSTFIFFGLVGVEGCYVLYSGCFAAEVMLPAAAIGLMSVGVLNMNNMRDMQNDARAGKRTLIVRFGVGWGRRYQFVLITLAPVLLSVYIALWGQKWQFLFLLATPVLIAHLHKVATVSDNKRLDPQLKVVSISTLLMTLLFVVGTAIHSFI
ncbi:MAG: 1,4-dihydroxy-2-naphthoate octaprenyltransferase [Bacteroidales bacterium]|nr:1,4-dihydroxy-2-naphthoate octaprenyltransferase [Bacteroidales bacterium]